MSTGVGRVFSTLIATLLMLQLLVIFPQSVAKAQNNGVKSIRLGTHEGFSRLVLAMRKEPRFSLRHLDDRSLILEFQNVKWQQDLDLTGIGDVRVKRMAIFAQPGRRRGLKITLARPVRDVRSFWWGAGNKLALDFYTQDEEGGATYVAPVAKPPRGKVIEAVRLGTHAQYSRLVLELSEKTDYDLKRNSARSLMLQVNDADLSESFSPYVMADPRVRTVSISSTGQSSVSFSIDLVAPADRVKHFWWENANRLILDIYNSPSKGEQEKTGDTIDVAKMQEEKGSSAKDEQPTTDAHVNGSMVAVTSPAAEKGGLRFDSSPKPNVVVQEQGLAPEETSSPLISPEEPSTSQGSSSANTPMAILEELIPTLKSEAAALLRDILAASRAKRADHALELMGHYRKRFQDQAGEPLLVLQGDLHFQLGLEGLSAGLDEAVDAYQDAAMLDGKPRLQVWALLQLGRIHLRQRRYLEALGYFDLLLGKFPQSPHRAAALVERGRLYLEKNRADLALEDFQDIIGSYPSSSAIDEALMGKAICLSLRGDYSQADEMFADLSRRIPGFYLKHPEILYYWGRNDLALERFQQARAKLFLVLNVGQQPQDRPLVLAHIGDSFRGEGMAERAISYYQLTMELFPDSEGAMVSRVRLAEETGNMDLLREIVKEHPESEMAEFALMKMAASHYEKSDYRGAIEMLQQLVQEYPTSSLKEEGRRLLRRSLRERAIQLRNQGDRWELLALLKTVKYWLSDGYQLKAAIWEAEAFAKLSLWDDAVAALQPISSDELEDADRLKWTLILAQAYEASGQVALAESLLRRTINSAFGNKFPEELRGQLAALLRRAGNHEQGIAAYRELLNGEMKGIARAEALVGMGKSLQALGQCGEAKRAFRRALSLSSEDQSNSWRSAVWHELGEIHYQEQSFDQAARAYEKALQYVEDPTEGIVLWQRSRLASCYEKLGSHSKAKHLYEKIEKDGGDLWRHMASVSKQVQELQTKITAVKKPED